MGREKIYSVTSKIIKVCKLNNISDITSVIRQKGES